MKLLVALRVRQITSARRGHPKFDSAAEMKPYNKLYSDVIMCEIVRVIIYISSLPCRE